MEDNFNYRRHRNEQKNDKMLKLRNVLNISFMALALVGIIVYFAANETIGTLIILVAMVIKMAECCIRMIHKP